MSDLQNWDSKQFRAVNKKIGIAESELVELGSRAPTPIIYQEIQQKKKEILEWKLKEEFFGNSGHRSLGSKMARTLSSFIPTPLPANKPI